MFDIYMQHCPNCGSGELKIIAAMLERPVVEKILTYLGAEPQPAPKGRAHQAEHDFAPEPRGPPRTSPLDTRLIDMGCAAGRQPG